MLKHIHLLEDMKGDVTAELRITHVLLMSAFWGHVAKR